MAASTISRSTWTDGVGGTTINNAVLGSDIYDKIDALWSSGTFTVGGLFAAEGFGDHLFSGGGTGANTIQIRNTSAGTTNMGSLEVGNDSDADLGRLEAYASTFTETAGQKQNGVQLRAMGAGGLSLSAEAAAGDIRMYSNNSSDPAVTIDSLVTKLHGPLVWGNIITDNITGNQDNYAPTGLATANVLEITMSGSPTISGLDSTGIVDGQVLLIRNGETSGSDTITFSHNSASSTDANRFHNAGGGNKLLQPFDAVYYMYRTSVNRWCLLDD